MSTKGKGSGDTSLLLNGNSGDGDAIKVFVRVRPLTAGTGLTTDGDQNLCLTVTSPNTIRLHSKPDPRTFTYDHVADMDFSQEAVFSSVAKNIVESCINGYNGTIFAYGQTGSGKTFTMLGPSDCDSFSDDLRGVIPRSFEYLFFLINREVEKSGNLKSFLCKCSFIEIYNEQIYDLLDSASASLFLRENIKKGVFVEGAVEKCVTSAAEAYQVLSMGWRNRRVASTSMNRESSRSHAVFTMTLESKETDREVVNIRTSQLNLVDLAGSERQKDTHTEGSRLKEASSINRSLMCLGQVIMALVDVSNGKTRHICYRDSKLTFLLKDSLGGNAKTCIIANVHPGSKCFGETWSTLQFAQRAKLIKNKAMINEDTHGNVRQLQAEVKKLKDQLAQALLSHRPQALDSAPGGPQIDMGSPEAQERPSYREPFKVAVLLWKKREDEKKVLQQKLAQLELAWAQKEKFVQSNRMIVRFREDHIARLEQKLNSEPLLDQQNQTQLEQLQQEISILRDQLEHHPRMMRYQAENFSLREEVCSLRALDSVKSAQLAAEQCTTELEEAFHNLAASEKTTRDTSAPPTYSTPVTAETISKVSVERLKAQLMQKQSELTATVQAFEDYKQVTKKGLTETEAEMRYLEKSNKHLENILEATKAHTKQEVSQLNKIHAETLKILTTPTRTYNLRNRLVPLASPEHLNGYGDPEESPEDLHNEQPPLEMNELACEALSEELRLVQEQAVCVKNQLDDEEAKSRKLLQQISKLEEQIATATEESRRKEELFSTERSSWAQDQGRLQQTITSLEQKLSEEKGATELLRSEVYDLRVVLQSSDKELAAARSELNQCTNQEQENTHLSSSLISTQLQLDQVKLEFEQVLEEQRALQDAFDALQAEAKFDADQNGQQLEDSRQDNGRQQAKISELESALQEEREQACTLTSQLKESRENTSKELVQYMEENVLLRKQVQVLTSENQQQVESIRTLEQRVISSEAAVTNLEQKIEQDRGVVLDLINQTRDLRSELLEKDQNISLLTGDLKDISVKYTTACSERESLRERIGQTQVEMEQLREASERRVASERIEMEMLQDSLAYATEEVERLTKVFDEQTTLLQAAQDQITEREATIKTLQDQLSELTVQVNKGKTLANEPLQQLATPTTLPQTPHTPRGMSMELSQVLESQEIELESRRSSMMSMELLLAELNAERSAKNEEIQRLKANVIEKEMAQLEIQTLLNQFYTQNGNHGNPQAKDSQGLELPDAIYHSVLRELHDLKNEKSSLEQKLSESQETLQGQETTLSQSQTCVQELTSELRNRCLELRDLRLRGQEHDQLLQDVAVLRKQVDHLAEENGKLVGHQNHRQKIEYLVKLKKENTKLQEENEKLKSELDSVKEWKVENGRKL
ncbi:kinesin-like protein KIF15-A [Clupea harengus]|uniref:Kinesin-like protein KIF15-A n=1 Tax=Clupea harengus TaxID=7950 RepID=A0A6P8G8S0_CLUHA|nr:kinesin-like protein KIF15-A [Clupea harengus]